MDFGQGKLNRHTGSIPAAVAAAQSGTQSNRAGPRSTFTVEAVSRAPYYSEAGIQPLATSSLSRDCGRP